ncbi:preprotein translocase subunit YajC [Sorangium sp. So ce1024]|uniref:preprotein translocase subunit YajC n=1 Tax=unclassified Sorangium TaxID=2621164 RepID=UPI003F00E097
MASSNWFQPNAAPGRAGNAPAAPAEGQPSPPSGGEAPPAPFGGGAFSFLILALPLLLIFVMTRSQNKKQKQLEASLKVGDRVYTQSGILGRITDLSPNSPRVKLEIAPGVNVQILKSAIQGPDPGEAAAADAKAADKAKEPAKDKKS